jgi:hypothetical protein
MVSIPSSFKFFESLIGTKKETPQSTTRNNQTEQKKQYRGEVVDSANYESRLSLSHKSLKTFENTAFNDSGLSFPDKLFSDKKGEPDYQVKRSRDGSISVSFKIGCSPDYKSLVDDIFSGSKEIKTGAVNSSHPFTTMNFEVDGKEYILTELTGGFVPSSSINIKPVL